MCQAIKNNMGSHIKEEKKQSIVHRIAITQARINLGWVVKRVYIDGEYFILEKGGIPVVGIMRVGELESYLGTRGIL